MKTIHVCKKDNGDYFLRIYFSLPQMGTVRFETSSGFSKSEADFRAMNIASSFGLQRDELPTHPEHESYPMGEES
jgi:hypothetical protein